VSRNRTADLLRAALVAALVAIGALIALPLGPVPMTLQVLVVAVATLVLSPAEALLAMVLYVALGAIGMPVFSGGGAGVGVLVGPTGGFILGFVLGAPAGARVRVALERRDGVRGGHRQVIADAAALAVLLVCVYMLGWAGFAISTGRAAGEAFGLAVAPFVLVDAVKCAVALPVARAVRAALPLRA